MTGFTGARLLEELITDLARVLVPDDADPGRARRGGIRPVRLQLDLPIETRVGSVEAGRLVVLTDVPATRTRTSFDRPLGRLSITLTCEAAP